MISVEGRIKVHTELSGGSRLAAHRWHAYTHRARWPLAVSGPTLASIGRCRPLSVATRVVRDVSLAS